MEPKYELDPRHHHFHVYHKQEDAIDAANELIGELPAGDWVVDISRNYDKWQECEIFVSSNSLSLRVYPVAHLYYSCAPLHEEPLASDDKSFFEVVATDPCLAVELCTISMKHLKKATA